MRWLVSRWRLWLPAAAVLLALPWLGLTCLDHNIASRYGPQIPFDAARWASVNLNQARDETTDRQQMIRDLVVRVLPGKTRAEIEALLGGSPMPADMRLYTDEDLRVREKDEQGNWKPFPRTGEGYSYGQFDWDLMYPIGREQVTPFDRTRAFGIPYMEVFLIRLDAESKFSSWYVAGSRRWPLVVGGEGTASYRAAR